MVFETVPDKLQGGGGVRSEEEKLQRFIQARAAGQEDEEAGKENQEGSSWEEGQFELDNVNQHECMKGLKRCINKMQELFGSQWEADRAAMPLFMHALNVEIRRPDCPLNVKIFILKILVNKYGADIIYIDVVRPCSHPMPAFGSNPSPSTLLIRTMAARASTTS